MEIIKDNRRYVVNTDEQVEALFAGLVGGVVKIKHRLINQAKSYSDFIYTTLRAGIDENFERGRAGELGWPRLKRITYVMRAMKGYPIQKYPVLHRTGALENGFVKSGFSVTKLGNDNVAFTLVNRVPYATIQNEGGVVQAESITLKSTYKHEGRARHYKVLVQPGARGAVDVQRKYHRYGNSVKRKKINVIVPARHFAFISQSTWTKLKDRWLDKIIQKELMTDYSQFAKDVMGESGL